jgi:hypothetical protein
MCVRPSPPSMACMSTSPRGRHGRDLPQGKAEPMIFLIATGELGPTPARCFIVEDAAVAA